MFSKEVQKLLQENDDFVVRGIDAEIAELQDTVERTKNKKQKTAYINRVEELLQLRKTVLWG